MEFLPVDSQEGQDYIKDMLWAQAFAFANREQMVEDARLILIGKYDIHFAEEDAVNIHHNFAQQENHFGENVWVHRKGATPARTGQLGIIPGSMATGSFIVEGLGNKDSFMSCSHGAGRRLGRKKAKEQITMNEFRRAMSGIVADVNEELLDEAPQAYKDLGEVMQNQSDLVNIIHKLRTILNIKGQ